MMKVKTVIALRAVFFTTIFVLIYYNHCFVHRSLFQLHSAYNIDGTYTIEEYLLFTCLSAYIWSLCCVSQAFGVTKDCFDENIYQSAIFSKFEKDFMEKYMENHGKRHDQKSWQPQKWHSLFDKNRTNMNGTRRCKNCTYLLMDHIVIDVTKNKTKKYAIYDIYDLSKEYTIPIVFKGILNNSDALKNWDRDWLINNYGNYTVRFTNRNPPVRYQDMPMCAEKNVVYRSTWKEHFDNKSLDTARFWALHNDDKLKPLLFDSGVFDGFASDVSNSIQAGGMWVYDFSHCEEGNDDDCDSNNDIYEWRLSSDFHSEPGPFMFAQLKGKKAWRLVDASFSHLMRPVFYGMYAISNVYYSSDHFEMIPKYEIELNAGDMLFVPPWMWHEVHVEKQGLEMSLSLRMFNVNHNMKIHPYWTINSLFGAVKALIVNPNLVFF